MNELPSLRVGAVARALLRIPVPWVYVLAYLLGAGLETVLLRTHPLAGQPIAGGIGAAAFLIGAALAAWGWLTFHRVGTTRVPGEASTTMVNWGPYRFTRNPMYLGLACAYLGEAGLLRQVVPILLLPLVIVYVNRIVIPVEEQKLREVFRQQYDDYQRAVRRWL